MKYLYYRFYRFALLVFKNSDPELKAVFPFMLFQILDFYSISQFYYYIFNPDARHSISGIGIGIVIIIILANYFLFIYKNKYLIIFNKYKDETSSERTKGIILAYLFILISLIFIIYTRFFLFPD